MTRSLVERRFAAAARGYATSEVHAKGESLGRLVALTRPEPHWRVLDVATGAGHVALAFAPRVAHVTAADRTEEMLAEARALAAGRGIANLETVRARAEALPFPDAAFDLVTCRIAPHHFDDIPAFVGEAARVLRPGATFALVDNVGPDGDLVPGAGPDAIAALDGEYTAFEKVRDPSHVRALSLQQWRDVIAGSGLVLRHDERLEKVIDLAAWARRMMASDATIAELSRILSTAAPGLAAFLRPGACGDGWRFTLHEALILATKPG